MDKAKRINYETNHRAAGWGNNREFSKASYYYPELDGLLLSGSDEDVQPHHYGEGPLRCFNDVSPDRELWKFALIKAAIRQNKTIQGICRGRQILNV